jgi:hypothetical protein
MISIDNNGTTTATTTSTSTTTATASKTTITKSLLAQHVKETSDGYTHTHTHVGIVGGRSDATPLSQEEVEHRLILKGIEQDWTYWGCTDSIFKDGYVST